METTDNGNCVRIVGRLLFAQLFPAMKNSSSLALSVAMEQLSHSIHININENLYNETGFIGIVTGDRSDQVLGSHRFQPVTESAKLQHPFSVVTDLANEI